MTCSHKSELIVCSHVVNNEAEVEVLLVDEAGHVDYALCQRCSDAENPADVPAKAICHECASTLNIPATLPTAGRWQVATT
jgi:hypothetical protein